MYYRMPASVVYDCDPWFISYFWRILIIALGCKQSLSMTFHPKTDGLSERMNRFIEWILYFYVSAWQVN